ncbi:hypothetical protein K8I85_08370 [bacterium]|nr:hypothetical protein [bacterium]
MTRGERRKAAWASIHGKQDSRERAARPYLGLRFDCCGVYVRAYRNAERTAYVARCPRCGGTVRIRIGAEGVSSRFFRVT